MSEPSWSVREQPRHALAWGVCMVLDQTIGFLSASGGTTCSTRRARLFGTRDEASAATNHALDMVFAVYDMASFLAEPNYWFDTDEEEDQ